VECSAPMLKNSSRGVAIVSTGGFEGGGDGGGLGGGEECSGGGEIAGGRISAAAGLGKSSGAGVSGSDLEATINAADGSSNSTAFSGVNH
ncbi:MAG: hypothetical protein ABL888_13610, partial [Pirellulaceae bacterium]